MNLENKQLKINLNLIGKEYIQNIKSELESYNKKASGDLEKSLKYTILSSQGDIIELQIYANDYLNFIDKGRPVGGKLPPPKKLERWIDTKGLTSDNFKSSEQLSWAIAFSIQRNGIAATNILNRVKGKMKSRIKYLVVEGSKKDVKQLVENVFIDFIKK